jgi:hypothetical protein
MGYPGTPKAAKGTIRMPQRLSKISGIPGKSLRQLKPSLGGLRHAELTQGHYEDAWAIFNSPWDTQGYLVLSQG